MKILVTGASGFTGTAMLRYLAPEPGMEITALTRSPESPPCPGVPVSWETADLSDARKIQDIMSENAPEYILHLAGLNRGSFEDLFRTNVIGTKNLLDAMVQENLPGRLLVVSSSAVYGASGNAPIAEDTRFAPLSLYGISKAAEEQVALMYCSLHGIRVAIVRPFNLIGPGLSPLMVGGKIVRQIMELRKGERDALDLMEVQSSRDFVDVRDAVKAYWMLMSRPSFDTEVAGKAFNVGSGASCSISELIAILEGLTGEQYPVRLPAVQPEIAIPGQRSDTSRIHRLTGWRPEISLPESLRDMLTSAM